VLARCEVNVAYSHILPDVVVTQSKQFYAGGAHSEAWAYHPCQTALS